jgi:hypothetical protein
MNKREAEHYSHLMDTLASLGFDRDEREALRRISMTLRRWHELECGDGNGCIERDDDTGLTFWSSSHVPHRYRIPDRETGARKRLERIVSARNKRAKIAYPDKSHTALGYFVQTDPRGAALYILRPGDVPDGQPADSYYNRGVCVY